MYKRSIYTIITPLPPTTTRATAVEALHNHAEMIELNPLVIQYEKSKPPPYAPPDEYHCIWYELTDKISYLPGVKGEVKYKGCFHDLPKGLQTHVYAPAGLHIREKWSIGGNEAGEEREVIELGLANVPREGLYLREDVDMRCNVFLTSFVKKTLRRAHAVLVDRLVVKADLEDDRRVRASYRITLSPSINGSKLSRNDSVDSEGKSSYATSPVASEAPKLALYHELPGTPEYGAQKATTVASSRSFNHPSNAYRHQPPPAELA